MVTEIQRDTRYCHQHDHMDEGFAGLNYVLPMVEHVAI
jgi:hypothetical protein